MTRILFADTTHPKPYDFTDLANQAMGGTESSLLRTAHILATHGHEVSVFQQARTEHTSEHGIGFLGPDMLDNLTAPEHVVILRKFPQLFEFQQRFPKAQMHLWIHTYKNWEYVLKRGYRLKQPWQLITNSQTHAADCDRLLHRGFLGRLFNLFKPKVPIHACHNPILEPKPQNVARDLNKLLYLSAPNKGLDQVLTTFQRINRDLSDLRLCVANPGYRSEERQTIANVEYLGALPADQVRYHLASSLCVFYPQNSFAETFGLIYAEANALGTPVLAHDIGAAREILHPNNPLIDANNLTQITETLKHWQQRLPTLGYRQEFSQHAIYAQWSKALKTAN